MSGSPTDIAQAEAAASAARERFDVTLARLRLRLDPRVRARETWDDLRSRGEGVGDDALEFAYERPQVVAAIAGTGMLLILRRPLRKLAKRVFGGGRSKWDTPDLSRNTAAAAKAPGKVGERP